MRPLTRLALILAVVLSPPLVAQTIHPGGPTDGGVRATADLPASQHMRNTGGSDGAGLCVFTSIEHCSRWQSLVLAGLQSYMTTQPGGGYPDKVEQVITAFCRQNKRDIPKFIQHTGGDETVLDLAIKTGRMPGITYAGQDDFYVGQTIAHMVNLVYLDADRAAILDNNRPGVFVWMSRKQLLDRWRGNDANGRPLTVRQGVRQTPIGGGWTVIFLDGPPPPYVVKPPEALAGLPPDAFYAQKLDACPCGDKCPCGKECKCGPKCECDGPVMYGQCPGGRCPIQPSFPPPLSAAQASGTDEYMYVQGYGWCKVVKPTPPAPEKKIDPPAESAKADPPKEEPKAEAEAKNNFGIDIAKLRPGKWFHNGAEVSREAAMAAVAGDTFADDSDKWFLVHVGTPTDQAAFLAAAKALDPAVAGKVQVKAYSPADWPVSQFALPAGVSLRKPAVGRVGAEAGRLAGEVSADTLKRFVADSLSPKPVPQPMPAPAPSPTPPPTPDPQPQPTPAPEPAPAPSNPLGVPTWLLAAGALAALVFFFRRKQ